jgi:hypothetical protein
VVFALSSDLLRNNSALPFVTALKFLGLLTAQSLGNLICDGSAFSVKSFHILNFYLAGPGGGYQTVMFRLYLALIRSKVDYGSSVYGFAMTSEVSVLDVSTTLGSILPLVPPVLAP